MTSAKVPKGQQGELLAQHYLRRQGFAIVERNWRDKTGEVDIIAKSPQGEIVIIEVKARQQTDDAWEAVNSQKQRKLSRLARSYLLSNHFPLETPLRFDVVVVNLSTGAIDHEPNAFMASQELE